MSAGRAGRGAITLIGVDCATQAKNVGLARGRFVGGRLTVAEVFRSTSHAQLVETILAWLRAPALLAFDAPLGWPAALGDALAQHRAGAPLELAGELDPFTRLTDRLTWKRNGQRPLDVGADRIARTAHAALTMAARVRAGSGLEIPLAWAPGDAKVAMIEVYPAATLRARGLDPRGYKGPDPDKRARRAELLASVRAELKLELADAILLDSDHALDAALCLLAAADFLRGDALAPTPEQRELARREGWIWARPRADR